MMNDEYVNAIYGSKIIEPLFFSSLTPLYPPQK